MVSLCCLEAQGRWLTSVVLLLLVVITQFSFTSLSHSLLCLESRIYIRMASWGPLLKPLGGIEVLSVGSRNGMSRVEVAH